MAIRVIKEVNREAGRMVVASKVIIAGMPLEIAANNTVQPYSNAGGSAATFALGLASESNLFFPLQGANGMTAGAGYDYTNFNRGGLVGAFVNGGEFALSGDAYGPDTDGDSDTPAIRYPYAQNDTWVLNGPVYACANGVASTGLGTGGSDTMLTSRAGSTNQLIGSVMDVQGSAPVTQLTIKLLGA